MKVVDLIENEVIHDTEKIGNLSNLSFFQSWKKVLNWVKWVTFNTVAMSIVSVNVALFSY